MNKCGKCDSLFGNVDALQEHLKECTGTVCVAELVFSSFLHESDSVDLCVGMVAFSCKQLLKRALWHCLTGCLGMMWTLNWWAVCMGVV